MLIYVKYADMTLQELWPGAMTYAGLVYYTMAARSNSPRPQATNLSIVSDRSGETTPTGPSFTSNTKERTS